MNTNTNEHAHYLEQLNRSRQSAKKIVPHVIDLCRPSSVVDIGCGIGAWLAEFQEAGVADILGIDGDWVPRELLCVHESKFRAEDIRKPLSFKRRFDLAVSLEVAEHLPEKYAEQFVELLTGLAPVILFSAAIPGQGGPGHVNEQWPKYWLKLFRSRDYQVIDPIRSEVWEDDDVSWWFAQNIMMYVHTDFLSTHPALLDAQRNTRLGQLSLVHPRKYEAIQRLLDRDAETQRKNCLADIVQFFAEKLGGR